jgi:hypothetical protein
MNIEELKRLAEAATPGPWYDRAGVLRGTGGGIKPIATIYNGLNSPYIAASNPTAILELIRQRDELLAALKDAREMVDDWGAYATAYMQEKHDLAGDLERLDAAISKAEEQS